MTGTDAVAREIDALADYCEERGMVFIQRDRLLALIAAALLAERERCARIAETCPVTALRMDDMASRVAGARSDIALAIRSGEPPT